MKEALAVIPQPAEAGTRSLMAIIDRAAMDPQFDVAKLQALLAVKKEWEADEARKAFVVALNAFKANPPQALKQAQVAFDTGKGKTSYKHAALDKASEIIGAALASQGISHRWNVEQDGANIKVTCILTHALGHSEQVSMTAQADTSGSKNSIQAVGSAVSYLQRYTLFSVSGIAPKNVDDDGRGGGDTHEMDAKAKDEYFEKIAALEDKKAAEVLWQTIATECTKAGDIPAYTALKSALSAKVKALNEGRTI